MKNLLQINSNQFLSFLLVTFPALGWSFAFAGIIQVPLWALIATSKQKGNSFMERFRKASRPTFNWGPLDSKTLELYQAMIETYKEECSQKSQALFARMKRNVFG